MTNALAGLGSTVETNADAIVVPPTIDLIVVCRKERRWWLLLLTFSSSMMEVDVVVDISCPERALRGRVDR